VFEQLLIIMSNLYEFTCTVLEIQLNFAAKNLGKLLMVFFANQTNPYRQLSNQTIALDSNYQDIVNIAVVGYQAHYYLNMIKHVYGESKHDEVMVQITKLMNADQPDYDFFTATINLIDTAVKFGEIEVPDLNLAHRMPLELTIALTVLLGLPGSPHYAPQIKSRETEIQHMEEDIEEKFARYLSIGKDQLIEWLSPMLEQLFGADYSKLTLPSR